MSNFTTIYDQLIGTTIPALTGFNTKTQIVNPYSIEENDINLLRNGWGILIGPASESPRQEYKYTRVVQEISFLLTRVVRATDHNKTPLETATKSLIEDAVLIRLDLYDDDEITIPSNIEKIDFTNRSGVSYIPADGYNIIFTIANFNFEIRETL